MVSLIKCTKHNNIVIPALSRDLFEMLNDPRIRGTGASMTVLEKRMVFKLINFSHNYTRSLFNRTEPVERLNDEL